jgi:hypothetical protein
VRRATLLTIAAKGGANATAKVLALVAGMAGGADSIDDMDLLRTAGWVGRSTGPRALDAGTFLRAFIIGHVRWLDVVSATLLARLTADTPVINWYSSTSTTPSGGPTATPSKAPGAATPASRA